MGRNPAVGQFEPCHPEVFRGVRLDSSQDLGSDTIATEANRPTTRNPAHDCRRHGAAGACNAAPTETCNWRGVRMFRIMSLAPFTPSLLTEAVADLLNGGSVTFSASPWFHSSCSFSAQL
jgi:hypothetical protein